MDTLLPNVSTQNRFAVFQELEMDQETNDNSQDWSSQTLSSQIPTTQPTKNQRTSHLSTKTPPIIISPAVMKPLEFHRHVQVVLGTSSFRAIYRKNETKIFVDNEFNHRKLVMELKKSNIKFYTFTPKSERLKKTVLKVAPFTTEEEIINTLRDRNISDVECLKLKSKKNEQTSSFLLMTKDPNALKNIKKIDLVDDVRVKFEDYHRKNVISQCHNCQNFGHGSSNCNLSSRCVKCAGKHATKNCNIKERTTDTSILKCCNCGGNHTANYTQCEYYLSYLEKLNNQRVRSQKSLPAPRSFTSNIISPSISYSHALNPSASANAADSNSSSANDFRTLLSEVKELNALIDIKNLISIIREFKSQLKSSDGPFEQIMLLTDICKKFND